MSKALATIILALASLSAWPQAAPISGSVINQFGSPVAGAPVRICSVTSTGTPCSPVASIFADYNLTQPLPNPTQTDVNGNFVAYVGVLPFPNLYEIQAYPNPPNSSGQPFSWVVPGPFLSASAITLGTVGCIPTYTATQVLGGCVGVDASLYASLNAASAACPVSGNCVLIVNTSLPLAGNLTLPPTTTLQVNAPGMISTTGGTLTLNGSLAAGPYRIFTGNGAVALGPSINQPLSEWFGAVGDWNGTTGTDNTTALQTTINSMSSGCVKLLPMVYRTTAAISITSSNIGICGVGQGYKQFTLNPGGTSTIMMTSAGADIVDVFGVSPGSLITWNKLTNFALERSVLPTGTAKGLAVKYAAGYEIRGVTSQDSVYDFWFHGAPQYVTGGIFSANAGWGGTGPTGYSESVYGFFLDSAGGEASGTFFADNINATNSTGSSSFTSTAIELDGPAINDVFIRQGGSESTSYGAVINCTASSGIGCQDIHFTDSVFDGWTTSGIKVLNLNQGAQGSATFNGGWVGSSGASGYGIDCENSYGLNVTNMQIQSYGAWGVYGNGCQNFSVTNNTLTNITVDAIHFANTGDSLINGNNISAYVNSGTGIILGAGSDNNVISGNNQYQLSGTAQHAIYIDSTSNNNVIVGNKASGLFSLNYTNLGTNNGIMQQTAGSGNFNVDPATGNILDFETLNQALSLTLTNSNSGSAALSKMVVNSDTVSAALEATSSTFTGLSSQAAISITGSSQLNFLFAGVNEAHFDSSGNIVAVGSLTLNGPGCGAGTIAKADGTGCLTLLASPVSASLTTTSATSDNVTIAGMTSSGHCSLAPTNASAATNIATTYISAKTTNQITVTHTASSGLIYDFVCTPY